MTKPAKKPVNIRVDEELLEAFDVWATAQGQSRTRALERFMRASVGLEKPAKKAVVKKAKAAKAAPCVHPIGRRDHFGNCLACGEKVGTK